jgi:hypothetical protein
MAPARLEQEVRLLDLMEPERASLTRHLREMLFAPGLDAEARTQIAHRLAALDPPPAALEADDGPAVAEEPGWRLCPGCGWLTPRFWRGSDGAAVFELHSPGEVHLEGGLPCAGALRSLEELAG